MIPPSWQAMIHLLGVPDGFETPAREGLSDVPGDLALVSRGEKTTSWHRDC
jgi:hypothetical protein